ncbi:hypothetical protein [Xanthobacter wiegelii]|uniref:hypothetical protein n=1 Tax=Xanthobacter wiegelii TaxID=3119913 RepID=UPI00372CD1AA
MSARKVRSAGGCHGEASFLNYADTSAAHHALFASLRSGLPDAAHIEHVLSQLGDFVALAERSKDQKIAIGEADYAVETLRALHGGIRDAIRDVIRRGYLPGENGGAPKVAEEGKHVVKVDVAPNFYPALSSFWRLDLPFRACWAAGADAEPLMLRSV